ncbi:MAG TPA: hypothetical protein VIG94_12110 [Faecalibacter sp.]|uniref:hypothetical protein n=1 Tax=Faecalibacter sp. LW9 TaxID=3103144 RepID=UPI002AFF83A5|nr:hypothetical protein [Faecalibacter sp. LW9]
MTTSVLDEFQNFKNELAQLNIVVNKIEKVGNGSMPFYEIFYTSPRYTEEKRLYVQRHELDEWLKKFKEQYKTN